jgi:hypothetical protein
VRPSSSYGRKHDRSIGPSGADCRLRLSARGREPAGELKMMPLDPLLPRAEKLTLALEAIGHDNVRPILCGLQYVRV